MVQQGFSELSAPRQALIRQCQQMNFGEIVGLLVRDGEPEFGPQTQMLLDVKLDGAESRRPEQELSDFVLSTEMVHLFQKLIEIRDGSIEQIEVRAGIPRRIVFKAPANI